MRKAINVVLILCLVALNSAARASIVDAAYVPDKIDSEYKLLTLLSKSLPVRLGSATPNTDKLLSESPQLTKLVNLPAQPEVKETGYFSELFVRAIVHQEMELESFLIAIEGQDAGKQHLEIDDFRQQWQSVDAEKRVFLSFSQNDIELAQRTRKYFEANGFLTFMYLHEKGAAPLTNSVDVSTFFYEANNHLVIDSESSRNSFDTQVEREVAVSLKKRTVQSDIRQALRNSNTEKNRQATLIVRSVIRNDIDMHGVTKKSPCCRLCTRRKKQTKRQPKIRKCDVALSALTASTSSLNCGPVRCNPSCYGAQRAL